MVVASILAEVMQWISSMIAGNETGGEMVSVQSGTSPLSCKAVSSCDVTNKY